jgi:TonB family protein
MPPPVAENTMNVASVCIAVAVACALSPLAARAQSGTVNIAASALAVSSVASVGIAGLSSASIQALPGFPVKAYRAGYRQGRVLLGYTVNADGSVGAIEVLDANPVQVFTHTATHALAGLRFAPTGAAERRTVEFRFSAD